MFEIKLSIDGLLEQIGIEQSPWKVHAFVDECNCATYWGSPVGCILSKCKITNARKHFKNSTIVCSWI